MTVRKRVAVDAAELGKVTRSPEASRGRDLTTRWLQPFGGILPTCVPGGICTIFGHGSTSGNSSGIQARSASEGKANPRWRFGLVSSSRRVLGVLPQPQRL